ncbi:phosphoglycerate kinase [Blattabacterium cuenoti]|uniref:phosphoglycerate kinase n=1 Tax=Blattabacterium cuenoti TaxID=1653831 RepID=UPI00163C90A3|nr:phosphoglycerate kinase [Blattabacterium cuenoti]
MKKIKTVRDFNFEGKKVLIRVDFNVPINENYQIIDDTRIQYSIPTIKKILSDKGKVILISHFGRPKGKFSKNFSLKFLVNYLSDELNTTVKFHNDCIGEKSEKKANELKTGEILLLENLRFYQEEEKEDINFSKNLAKLADFYVNDAFSVSHRLHSSVSVLPKLFNKKCKCIGILMEKEILFLDKFLSGKGKKPVTVLLGGAKIYSKIKIIENLMDFSDHLLIGGGISYPFIKIKGGKIGNSIIEIENNKNIDDKLISILNLNNKKNIISLPTDVIISDYFDNSANIKICDIYSIPDKWIGLDIGPNSIKNFCNIINKSKTILWNGPMGVFELQKFSFGTKSIAKAIANATTKNKAFSLVGGGDSVAALKMVGYEKKISYLSTGGGAMLEYLKNKNNPGIQAMMV